MSDMRDFNGPEVISEEINGVEMRPGSDFSERNLLVNDNASLGEFHVVDTESESNTGRIVGALAVALLLGTAGVFAYHESQTRSAPTQVAAVAPPPAQAPAQTAAATPAPASAPALNDAVPQIQNAAPASTPAPVKSRTSIRAADNGSSNRSSASAVSDKGEQQAAVNTPAPASTPDQTASAAPAVSAPASPSNPSLASNLPSAVNPPADDAVQAPAAPQVQAPQVEAPAAPSVQAPAPADQSQPAP